MQKCRRHGQPLLVAQGQAVCHLPKLFRKAELPHHLINAPGELPAPQAVYAAIKMQILLHRQVSIEGKLLRHIADALPGLVPVAAHIYSPHKKLPGGGRQQAAQHTEGSGFPGAIGAQHAKDLPPVHLE